MARKPEADRRRGKTRPPARRGRDGGLSWPRALYWAVVLVLWSGMAVAGLVLWYAYDLPSLDETAGPVRAPAIEIYGADGALMRTVGGPVGETVVLEGLPSYLPEAVLAIEDRRFYDHAGIDPVGVLRAAFANLRAGAVVQGGSTITQQLAKNLFLSPERSLRRKVQEVLLALWLEYRFTKDEILALYLNRVYLGAGAYGVDAAARRYFGHAASRLTLPEAAVLAGLLKAPSRFAPTHDPARARERARLVLQSMVEAGYLAPSEAAAAGIDGLGFARARGRGGERYFIDWVLAGLDERLGPGRRDLIVVTTLSPGLQRIAERAVEAGLAGEGARHGAGEAALIALAPSGAVRAMVGGRDYGRSQFNRAIMARRQPGSAFKIFVYLAALEAGLGPRTRVEDAPIEIDGWAPANDSGSFAGPVTLEEAFSRSINTVAVRVAERVGRERVIATARRLGITTGLAPHPSTALGTASVTLAELTGAYAALANDGRPVVAYGIEEIRDRSGRILYGRSGSGLRPAVTAPTVGAMNRMLGHVIERGTGRAARLDRPMGGKTGTSQDFRDAWFVGLTADLVAGVWVGNDDGRPMRGVTGGGLPARIWRAFMAEALSSVPPRSLPGTETRIAGDAREPQSFADFLGRLRERLGLGGG